MVLVIFAFQAFAQIDILTGGGPAGATETLVYKIFNSQHPVNQGTGAVMAIGLFGITFVVSLLQFVLLERRVHYGELKLNHARWKQVDWYLLLSGLSVVVLFPVYMTLVRALSTPVALLPRPASPCTPSTSNGTCLPPGLQPGRPRPEVTISAVVTAVIVVAELAHHLGAGRLRVHLPGVPAPPRRCSPCSWRRSCCRSRSP